MSARCSLPSLLFAALLLQFELVVAKTSLDQPSESGASRLGKRRTNYTVHSPEQLAYLQDFNDNVGYYLWIGLAIIIGTVTALNWLAKLQSYFRRREAGFRSESKRLPRVKSIEAGRVKHSVSLRFFWYWLAAFWRKYSIKHNGIAEAVFLGDLGQLFLIAVYLALNFLLIFCGTANDVDWMAHHAAKLTYANLPLIIGLAGKNNVLSRLTGFAYESLNVLHRWSARFVIISSAIHIGGRIHVNVPSSDPGSGRRYIAWGWAAFALFIYMIIAASRSFRNRYYQFFLIQHVTLWFVIVASLVIHRPQEQKWIWAGFALHGLDRIARGMRILYYHAIKKTEKSEENPQGKVTAVSEDTIRVSIRTRQNWIPGQHVFLHCPDQSPGGHPFTVSNISRDLTQANNSRPFESTQELLIRVRGGLTKHLFNTATNAQDDETAVEGRGGKQSFPREPVPIRAWTEGPYGHEKYLGEDHNTLLLVAGGSGVSYTLSNSLDIVRRARAMHLGTDCKSLAVATKRLHFLWMVKKPEQVEWIGDHLRGMLLHAPPGLLTITLFITGKRRADEPPVLGGFVTDDQRDSPPSDENEKSEKRPSQSPAHVEEKPPVTPTPAHAESSSSTSSTPSSSTPPSSKKVEHGSTLILRSGRPDFREIISTELEATDYADWIAVGACGPTPMNDSLADAVSEAVRPIKVLRGELRRNIYLTIEEFGW